MSKEESKTLKGSRTKRRPSVRLNDVSYKLIVNLQSKIFEKQGIKIPYAGIVRLALDSYELKVNNGFV